MALERPFRARFLAHEELTALVRSWQKAHPEIVRLASIGTSPEGRELWVLELGPEPDRVRPAAWVDGNMHACELAGSSVALGIAADVIELHLEARGGMREDHPARALPPAVRERLRETLFYVMPRVSPDGAEAVLREGRYVRSVPRDRRPHAPVPRWICSDVDGDGLALTMRVEDPLGEFAAHPTIPGLVVPRTIEDAGPFYKVYPEGLVEHFDGRHVPSPHYLSDNDADLNRNFPWSWMPEPEQIGAGAFPGSEPESRAIIEWVTARPHVFSWLNLHTFGGVYIRPLGHAPDRKMDPQDLAIYHQVAEWGEKHGGYPTVSGFEEFTYEPDKPLHGDMADFAYHVRGAIAYVCEIWDLFARLGIERKKPFVDHYTKLGREDLERLHRWDAEHNASRIFRPWKKATHPQLGEVEIGGLDPRVGIFNPPYELLGEACDQQSAAYLRVAAMAPSLRARVVSKTPVGQGAVRVDVEVRNEGYLPTYVLSSAKKLALDARIFVEARCDGGATLVSDGRVEAGHLEGWGRGLHTQSIFFLRGEGTTASRVVSFVVAGSGRLHVRAHGLRVGSVKLDEAIGQA
jgi:hypothetical protein